MFRAAIAILLVTLTGSAVWAEESGSRVALVIGASAYRHVPTLPNTLNDARAVAAALTRIGFEVDTVLDPDRAGLEGAVRRFGRRATGADAALFYYAGHALEFAGRNWLVPVQADLHNERDLRFEALEIDAVLEQIEGQARVSVLVLDSCRNNPFQQMLAAGTRGMDLGHGLAPQSAAVGTLVVYATAPGTEAADGNGPHSPFTAALLNHIETPGLEIRSLISDVRKDVRQATGGRQIPWDSSALEGEFFLRAAAPVVLAPDRDAEVVFWNSVRDTSDAAELRAYLSRYPNGTFAELARNRLARLSQQPPQMVPVTAQASVDLESALREALSMVSEKERDWQARHYVSEGGGRALSVAPGRHLSWRSTGQPDDASAETAALEGCQIFLNEPCMLVARGDRVLPKNASGSWPVQSQPRVTYRGDFDLAMVPVLHRKAAPSASVFGYKALAEPKALAVHPRGLFFAATGGDQATAESAALLDCNDDPSRKGEDGPCFLYAVDDRVVLSDRRTTASPSLPQSPADLESALRAALSTVPEAERVLQVRRYLGAKGGRALAIAPRHPASWLLENQPDDATAEIRALEGCQMFTNEACMLVARGDRVLPKTASGAWPVRPRARVAYRGEFDPVMVPALLPKDRSGGPVPVYNDLAGSKVLAIHPWGRVFLGVGADQTAAATLALKACNDDPIRKGANGPCFLYAIGSQVVLPDRRTTP